MTKIDIGENPFDGDDAITDIIKPVEGENGVIFSGLIGKTIAAFDVIDTQGWIGFTDGTGVRYEWSAHDGALRYFPCLYTPKDKQ